MGRGGAGPSTDMGLARKSLGLSQEQFAHLLDLDERTLACIERGNKQSEEAVQKKLFYFLNLARTD